MSYKKKLIEVALPLDAINRESAREKTIRHGHPSTFHLWWARRPLAACRAVLFSSFVDDPSAHPERFPTEEAQDRERERLFGIIKDLVKWENTTNEEVFGAASTEIASSFDGRPPPVLDPFCGGGSIPLEAQRLALEVDASDLNPVAVLITKALVEIPPRFAGRRPVHPQGARLTTHPSQGVEGLVDDVRHYARWMRDEAERRVGPQYPEVTVPRDHGGGTATVIAWIWARTITCPNPACGSQLPLVNSLALSRRRGREVWLEPAPDRVERRVGFRVRRGPGCTKEGSVGRTGATCFACGATVPLATVRGAARDGGMNAQLVCTVAEGPAGRLYVPADDEQVRASRVEFPRDVPETELPEAALGFRVQGYGISHHRQLFTNRQLVTLTTFCDLVSEARRRVLGDGADPEYADAVATYLGLCIGRLANRCSSQSFWDAGAGNVQQVFARNALPMIWVFAEANPFSDSSGNFLGQVEYLADALARVPAGPPAHVRQLDATAAADGRGGAVCTDPPYYDNVPYADLSDFFYVWLRRCLSSEYPELFSTILTPKSQELIAEPARQGSWEAATKFFEEGLRRAFENMLAVQDDRVPLTLFYAFRQTEDLGDGAGHVSTGWETMLSGLLDAGASITGTWPVRTEQPGGLREVGRAALASSIVIVCRSRPTDASLTNTRDFLAALRAELPDALRRLQHGNIAPVDLAQAAIGPGMAVFSRYAKVMQADGEPMPVRAALGLINQVLDEILAQQEGDLDQDTRWAVAWFEECGTGLGPFGKAETLSKAKNTALNGLVEAGIVRARGNQVQLLGREELAETWDPARDTRLTIWEVSQLLIRRLESGGEPKAAELLARVGGLGDAARELAYRLYTICEHKKWAKEALAYNSLVVAWPEIARLATGPARSAVQQELV